MIEISRKYNAKGIQPLVNDANMQIIAEAINTAIEGKVAPDREKLLEEIETYFAEIELRTAAPEPNPKFAQALHIITNDTTIAVSRDMSQTMRALGECQHKQTYKTYNSQQNLVEFIERYGKLYLHWDVTIRPKTGGTADILDVTFYLDR